MKVGECEQAFEGLYPALALHLLPSKDHDLLQPQNRFCHRGLEIPYNYKPNKCTYF